MLDDVLGYLRCPHCGDTLTRADGSLRCAAGHSFDIARQGYVSLLPAGAPRHPGDTAAMVRARDEFLRAGHFAGVAAALADAAVAALRSAGGASASTDPADARLGSADAACARADEVGCVVDVGAGTGYYLAAVLDRLPQRTGLALDISKNALRLAARAHRRIGAVACDAWRPLPVADAVADLVLNAFAPRDGAELSRIIRPAGQLLIVTPTADHLGELIEPLGLLTVDERKSERLAAKLSPYFDLIRDREHRAAMSLDHAAVTTLTAMGPSSWHADRATLAARVERLPEPMTVTLAVRLSTVAPTRDRPSLPQIDLPRVAWPQKA